VVLPAIVDWQIVDCGVMQRWRMVDRHPSGTEELVRAQLYTMVASLYVTRSPNGQINAM